MSLRLREVAISNCSTSAFQAVVSQLDTNSFFKVSFFFSFISQAPKSMQFTPSSRYRLVEPFVLKVQTASFSAECLQASPTTSALSSGPLYP
jgi:hypothetical protein